MGESDPDPVLRALEQRAELYRKDPADIAMLQASREKNSSFAQRAARYRQDPELR